MKNLQKTGGIAALIHGAAYLIAIALAVTLIFPVLDAPPDQYLAFLADNQGLMYIWILIAYLVPFAVLVVLALALYHRLKDDAPALIQTSTVFGFIWAALILASGNLMLHDFGVLADLYSKDPVQAETVWLTLEAVENGIISGNELVGSLWVLLLSLAALQAGGLPRALNYLGVALAVSGILTLVPAFNESAGSMIFGLGMIVWSVWVGIVMVRGNYKLV